MTGFGSYNIPQDSIKSVSLSSIYPPYTFFNINSQNITAYSSTGEYKNLNNNAIINSSGSIIIKTSLAYTSPEYLGNLIISPLFFEVTASQALISSNNNSAFIIHDYYLKPYPVRVAFTVIFSTFFGISSTQLITQFFRKDTEK